MTARKACYLIAGIGSAFGMALLGCVITLQIGGPLLAILVFMSLGSLFIGLDALVCALFRTHPGQALGDDALAAALDILFDWK